MRATVNSENRWKRALTAPAIRLRCQLNTSISINIGQYSAAKNAFLWFVSCDSSGNNSGVYKTYNHRFDNESVLTELNFCELWTLKSSYSISMFFDYHFIRNLEIVSEIIQSEIENCWKPGRTIHIEPLAKLVHSTNNWRLVRMHLFEFDRNSFNCYSNVRLIKILVSISNVNKCRFSSKLFKHNKFENVIQWMIP